MNRIRKTLIDGESYTLTLMGSEQSMEVYPKLFVEFAKLKPSLVGLDVSKGDQKLLAFELLSRVPLEKFDPSLVKRTYAVLASTCKVMFTPSDIEGKPTGAPAETLLSVCGDHHFAGRAMHMLRWMAWAMSENYSDFLGFLVAFTATSPESKKDAGPTP